MSDDDDKVTFAGAVADKESEKALHIKRDKGVAGGWVPKSVIHDDSEVFKKGHKGKLVLKEWWAGKNGWL